MVVVDELGRLGLEHGTGLTDALAALDAGPTACCGHALAVVRESLLPLLEGRFGAWGQRMIVTPDDESFDAIVDAASNTEAPA